MEFVACHLNEEGAIGMLRADQSSLYWTAIGVQSYWPVSYTHLTLPTIYSV